MLHISHQDASQELLLELLDHRLKSWSDKDVTLAIQRDLPSLKWRIKYAAKDYYRRVNKDANREVEKAHMVSHMTRQASNQAETLEALKLLKEMFKNANTRTWAESVLRVGKSETMVRFNQTPRQFNSKLTKVCKYCHQNQHQQPQQSNDAGELKLLKEWSQLMADPETSDDDVQDFISQHESYINEIVDSPLISYQGKVLKDFAHAGKDKYILVNLMTAREQELDRRTNHE
jgi:tRNA U55 pseudouridine synthase TruB